MSVPENVVQQDGIGTVTADQYNTYLQGAAFVNGLQNFAGVSGMTVFIPGLAAYNDGGQGEFYWNAIGTANDGVNNIQPNGVSTGCWTRLTSITGITFNNAALATTTTTGFAYLPTCAGTPTGVPAATPAGTVPVIYDTTDNYLYVYNGSWKKTTLS